MDAKEQLLALYSAQSKHSNYQILPSKLRDILPQSEVATNTRYESERLAYLVHKIVLQDKTVLDIGANTGYFSFEILDQGAASVHYYEGNKEHAAFVGLAAKALGVEDTLKITNGYYAFDGSSKDHYDVALLFNVLHHVGDDYGQKELTIAEAKDVIAQQLNSMSSVADTLVFQLGFNWHGNTTQGLFDGGTKREVIEYVTQVTKGFWDIESIGVAVRDAATGAVSYTDVDQTNIERDDSLGEFLNRPIFILKSIKP